jgi:sigma-54-specific transcriptional regulator
LQPLFDAELAALYALVEKTLVQRAFEHCDNNQVRTAHLLGISRNVLRALLKRYGFLAATGRTPREKTARLPYESGLVNTDENRILAVG